MARGGGGIQDAKNPDRPNIFGGPALVREDEKVVARGKRLSSPERWEIQQLVASGVLDKRYPMRARRGGRFPLPRLLIRWPGKHGRCASAS